MKIYNCISLIGLISLWLTGTSSASTPKNVRITNVTGSQFAVSWITDVEEIGYLRWGTNTTSLSEVALDDRDSGTPTIKSDTHHITVTSTAAISQTTCYYEIVSGTQTYPGSLTTGADFTAPQITPMYWGTISHEYSQIPATGTIVYLQIRDSDGQDTPGTSALRSVVSDAIGCWTDDPGSFRTSELNGFFTSSDNDTLWIYAEGGRGSSFTLTLKVGSSSPAPNIILPDTTAPETPIVTDEGACTASNTQLHATWQAQQDPESGIVEYQYALGTTPGGTDTVGWTSVGTETKVTKGNLSLVQGNIYYFSVKAKNGANLWSNIGRSDGIMVIGNLLSNVPVYPNPFIPSKGHTAITFGGLTKEVTIKIFTIAGELVDTIESSNYNGQPQWTPPNNLASGIYLYLITNPQGEQVKGKLGIIK